MFLLCLACDSLAVVVDDDAAADTNVDNDDNVR